MKNIKRILTVLMIATLVLLAFTSCSDNGGDSDGSDELIRPVYSGGGKVDCAACDGTGDCYACTDGSCRICGGNGIEVCSYCGGTNHCFLCKGSGKLSGVTDNDCPVCNGSGKCDNDSFINGVKYMCKDGTLPCDLCEGTGACYNCGGNRTCNICDGTGKIQNVGKKPSPKPVNDDYCYDCNNTGWVTCFSCDGDGECTYCLGVGWKPTNLTSSSKIECIVCEGSGKCDFCYGAGKTDCLFC